MNAATKKARDIAYEAHANQTDKAGHPYIEHVARVAQTVHFWPEAETVAWLHDVLEDCTGYDAIIANTFCKEVYRSCRVLDRNNTSSKESYYEDIKQNRVAFIVKLADIHDNADEKRLSQLDDKTAARLRYKYELAKQLLGV